MKSSDLNQITGAQADFGRLTLADGRVVEFIDLTTTYLRSGTSHTAPVLTMSPDQARTLAMQLLAAADKAQASGNGPAATSN